jgi:hypothetical protein
MSTYKPLKVNTPYLCETSGTDYPVIQFKTGGVLNVYCDLRFT